MTVIHIKQFNYINSIFNSRDLTNIYVSAKRGNSMLYYIKQNFKNLFTNQKELAVLLIIVQFFSVIVIIFSYGVSNHYNIKTDAVEGSSLVYEITKKSNDELINLGYSTENIMTHDQTNAFLNDILPFLENKLDYFFVLSKCDDIILMSSNGYINGEYTVSSQLQRKVSKDNGENFTDKDMNSGEKVVLAPSNLVDEKGYVTIRNEQYFAKGITNIAGMGCEVFIPYKSLPSDATISSISLILTKPLLEDEYHYIAKIAKNYFGEEVINITEFEGINNESQNRVYRDIIVITALLIIVCAINYCIIYRYILEKRRRMFAISRICGCTKYKANIVYMVELLGISFVTLIIGIFTYAKFILPEAVHIFEYIELFYNSNVYVNISIAYMTVLFLTYSILIMRFVRQTPVSLIREV